jgi:hypothetical protein
MTTYCKCSNLMLAAIAWLLSTHRNGSPTKQTPDQPIHTSTSTSKKYEAEARPAYKKNPYGLFDPPRGEVLADTLRLDIDPESKAGRRAIEVARISSHTWSGVRKRLYLLKDITVIHTQTHNSVGKCGQNVGTGWAAESMSDRPRARIRRGLPYDKFQGPQRA